jgi:hypothetical protein
MMLRNNLAFLTIPLLPTLLRVKSYRKYLMMSTRLLEHHFFVIAPQKRLLLFVIPLQSVYSKGFLLTKRFFIYLQMLKQENIFKMN